VDVKNLCKRYGCLEGKISCKERLNLEAVWELVRGTLINDSLNASMEMESSFMEQSQKLSKHIVSR
jgi:hypothetical protein